MKKISIFAFFLFVCCQSYQTFPNHCLKIEGVLGPEDFVFLENENLFLISSYNRRNSETLGEIYSYHLKTRELKIIDRINEPKDLAFYPHGIDFYQDQLFVILHGKELDTKWHAVAIYQWNGKDLIFKKIIQNHLFLSPNDIAVYSDSVFFITNDSKNRASFWEYFLTLVFDIKKGSIVVCEILQNQCKFVQDELGFPNGITIYKNQLFVSTTFENKIYAFTINKDYSLTNKKEIAKIQGGDNLTIYDQKLYVTSHPSLWKFQRHSKRAENRSPSIAYEIDLETFTIHPIFSDNGTRISASSVAIKLNNLLFLGQVFDPYLYQCLNP